MEEATPLCHSIPDPLVGLIAQRLRILGEPMRIKRLDRLREGPATVRGDENCAICSISAAGVKASTPADPRHAQEQRDVGIVGLGALALDHADAPVRQPEAARRTRRCRRRSAVGQPRRDSRHRWLTGRPAAGCPAACSVIPNGAGRTWLLSPRPDPAHPLDRNPHPDAGGGSPIGGKRASGPRYTHASS
jgi:hypothetical protein